MGNANLLTLVQAINTLFSLLTEFGLNFKNVATAIQKAQAEGREFGVEDLQQIKKDARGSLNALGLALKDLEEEVTGNEITEAVDVTESEELPLPEDTSIVGETPVDPKPVSK